MISNRYDSAVLPSDLVRLVEMTGAEARRVHWSGNPPHAPHVYGWAIRFGRHTSQNEKNALRLHGFWFSGGQWKRSDAAPPRGFTREESSYAIVSILAGMLGGDGWDDPRLPLIVDGWLSWPAYEARVSGAYLQEQADALVDQGFDPRHLLRD